MGGDRITGRHRAPAAGNAAALLALMLPLSMTGSAFAQEPEGTPKQQPALSAGTVPAKSPEIEPKLAEVIVTATGTNISGIKPVGSE